MLYQMTCRRCGHAAEVSAPMAQGPPDACPDCGAVEGYGQDWSGSPGYGFSRNTDTLGYVARQNEKRLGAEQTEKMWAAERGKRKQKPEAKKPWWRDGSVKGLPKKDKPLDTRKLKTKDQVDRYVNEGKAPP